MIQVLCQRLLVTSCGGRFVSAGELSTQLLFRSPTCRAASRSGQSLTVYLVQRPHLRTGAISQCCLALIARPMIH